MNNTAKPLWNPYVAGGILGLGLLATFLVTGHGLGVTGATTALTAKVSGQIAPGTVAPHSYLGTYFKHSLNIWVVWEVIGLMLGALGASLYGRRFKLKIDGPPHASVMVRIGLATLGGLFSGFGARAAMGCASGMGLSGSAPLAVAGFLFLIGFFAAGVLFGQISKGLWS